MKEDAMCTSLEGIVSIMDMYRTAFGRLFHIHTVK